MITFAAGMGLKKQGVVNLIVFFYHNPNYYIPGLRKLAGATAWNKGFLFDNGLVEAKKSLGDELFYDKWDDLVKMGVAAGKNADELFNAGFRSLSETMERSEIEEKWDDIVVMAESAWTGSAKLFKNILPLMKEQMGPEVFNREWKNIVELTVACGENSCIQGGVYTRAMLMLAVYMPSLADTFRLLRRIIMGSTPGHQKQTAESLMDLFSWLNDSGQYDVYSARVIKSLKKIASSPSNVNRVEEIYALLDSLKRSSEPAVEDSDEENPFSKEVAFAVSQGEAAPAEFQSKLQSGFYENEENRNPDLEAKISEFIETRLPDRARMRSRKWTGGETSAYPEAARDERLGKALKDFRIFVIPAIIEARDDFSLGYNDVNNRTIFLSDKVVDKLLRGPPEALKEYLWHELHERDAESNPAYHYKLITDQQREFEGNYKDRGYVKRRNWFGLLRYFSKYVIYLFRLLVLQPLSGLITKSELAVVLEKPSSSESFKYVDSENSSKIAKGLLGEKLREVINEDLIVQETWGKDLEGLQPYEAQIREIEEFSGENASLVIYSITQLKNAFPDQFDAFLPVLVNNSIVLNKWTPLVLVMMIENLPFMLDSADSLEKTLSDLAGLKSEIRFELAIERFFFESISSLASAYGDKFPEIWNDVLNVCKKTPANSTGIISGFIEMKKVFGEDLFEYWTNMISFLLDPDISSHSVSRFLNFAFPAFSSLITDSESFREVSEQLLAFENKKIGTGLPGVDLQLNAVYRDGVPLLIEMFGNKWPGYWKDIYELSMLEDFDLSVLVEEIIPEMHRVFGDSLKDHWKNIFALVRAAGEYSNPVLFALINMYRSCVQSDKKDAFQILLRDMLVLSEEAKGDELLWLVFSVSNLESTGFDDNWPRIVRILTEAGKRAGTVLAFIMPSLLLWDGKLATVERNWKQVFDETAGLQFPDLREKSIPEFLTAVENYRNYAGDEEDFIKSVSLFYELKSTVQEQFHDIASFLQKYTLKQYIPVWLPYIVFMTKSKMWPTVGNAAFFSTAFVKFIELFDNDFVVDFDGDLSKASKAKNSTKLMQKLFSPALSSSESVATANSLLMVLNALSKKDFFQKNSLYREEVIRKLRKIANASDLVNKAEDLRLLAERIDSDLVPTVETSPYTQAVAQVQPHGFVARGPRSLRLWHSVVLGQGRVIEADVSQIQSDYSEVLDDHEIVLFNGIAANREDYFLATRVTVPGETEKKMIYIAEEVFNELKGTPDLLKELLWHEVYCTGENHHEIIARQQKMFRSNYEGMGYDFDRESGVFIDPVTGKIAKGALGTVLRNAINRIVENNKLRWQQSGTTVQQVVEETPDFSLSERDIEDYKERFKDAFMEDDIEEIETDFFDAYGPGAPEEQLKKIINTIKLAAVKELAEPHTMYLEGRPFYFISHSDYHKEMMIIRAAIDRNAITLTPAEEDLLQFLDISEKLEGHVRTTQWREVLEIGVNFFLRDEPELLEYMELVDRDSFYETMKMWHENLKLKRGDHDSLRTLVEMGRIVPDKDLEYAYMYFFEKVITKQETLAATEGDLENVKNIFTMFAGGAGAAQTNRALSRLDEFSGYFDNATNRDLIMALSEIAKGARKKLNDFVDILLNEEKYTRLFQRDIKRFQLLGVILAYTGPKGFDQIDFMSIYQRYGIKERSAEEVELLKTIGKLAALTGPETGDFLSELFNMYEDSTGNINDFNKLLAAQVYFIRMVNFHRDFEAHVNDGAIGKVNNETYYVSLRDMKKTLSIMRSEFEAGNPMRVAVRRAVTRRYYNRLGKEDREEVVRLMRKHQLLGIDEDLEYMYIVDGAEPGSESIRLYEQKPPKILQKKGEIIEEQAGEKQLLMDISLDRPFDGLAKGEVLNSSALRNLGRLLQALGSRLSEKINPVMLFGITAGGKSTIARIASKILGMGFTRIQITEQTDEFELFGSFQPYEINISLQDALTRLKEGLDNGEFNRLEEAFSRVEFNEEGRLFDAIVTDFHREKYERLSGEPKLAYRRFVIENWITEKLGGYLDQAESLLETEQKILRKQEDGRELLPDELEVLRKTRLLKTLGMLMDHEIGLRFVEGRFLEAYKRGDLILLDEVNLANEEMLGVLYQMLTLGYLEHNGKIIKPEGRMPKVMATANPSSYSGRNRMSEAFMNRFEIINVDDMTPKEMADILIKQLVEQGIDIEEDLGFKRKELVQLAETQRYLNNLLKTGKFSNMGQEQDYVFTFRDLKRIVDDVLERKNAGLEVDFETWIQEAYLQYRGVLVRQEMYDSGEFSNEDYRRIRNAFTLNLGFTLEGKNQEESFDEIIQKRFGSVDYDYNPETRTLLIDGIETTGLEPEEEVPCR